MTETRIAFVAAEDSEAQEALARLSARYGNVPPADAGMIVALGGDGFMLQTLHAQIGRDVPIYGMNRGSVGFLMNRYDEEELPARVARAEPVRLHPLRMTAQTASGAEEEALTINEVSLLRQTRQARAAIGVVPQELNIDPFFTPRELLDLQAGLYGVPPRERRTDEILAALGLADKAEAYTRTLSGGMRRRLMVAKAMVHNPPVLVLDEPTAGVDIELRQQLWGRVRDLNRLGTTILLTTHYLEEAEELCDSIASLLGPILEEKRKNDR